MIGTEALELEAGYRDDTSWAATSYQGSGRFKPVEAIDPVVAGSTRLPRTLDSLPSGCFCH